MNNRFTPPECSFCRDGWLDTGNLKGTKSGTPRRLCQHCGRTYHDCQYREPALTYYFSKPEPPVYRRWIASTFITAFLATYVLITFGINEDSSLSLLILSAAFILFFVRMYRGLKDHRHPKEYEERFQKQKMPYYRGEKTLYPEFSESLQRMSSEEYLYELISCGEDVPDYFFHRLETTPDDRQREVAVALYQERQRNSFLAQRHLELQNEKARYEEFLSLPSDSFLLRKQAEFHSTTPTGFIAYCRAQLEKIEVQLDELLSDND